MKCIKTRWFIPLLLVSLALLSFTACSSSKEVSYLPEQYLDWSVADASITMKQSKVVKSQIIVTLEGKSIQLDYENGQLKESDAISQKTTQLTGRDLVKCLETCAKDFEKIVQNDTVLIGITGDTSVFETLNSGKTICLYRTDSGKLTETTYDGEGGIAWGSIMDGDYMQTYLLVLR